jgi:flagellar assembly protein FliH
LSDTSKHRVLRAVRLLPNAVRVGRGGLEELEDDSGGVAVACEPESGEKSALIAAEAEVRKLKSELRDSVSALSAEREAAEALRAEMASLRADLDKEKANLYANIEREAAGRKEAADREGYAEGSARGYSDGLAKADAEKREEYEGKFAEAHSLLNSINRAIQESREKLALTHAPQLIRLWEIMLERMLLAHVSLDPSAVERLLEGILKRVSDRERVLVYLNPADISMIENSKEGLVDSIRGVKVFEFLSDDYIDKGSCLVETNLGIYDARWKTQLEQVAGEVEELLLESMASNGPDGGN